MSPRIPRITLSSVYKKYGRRRAVDELSLTLNGGSVCCLLGPNGAGKTTALELIMGLRSPSRGQIRINGVGLDDPAILLERRRIGFLPQAPILYDNLTGREHLRFIGQLYDVGPSLDDRIEDTLSKLRLTADADRLIRGCSAGAKKKLALAAALLHDPEILICDEPMTALDPLAVQWLKSRILDLKKRNRLILFATHLLAIAETLADRLAILHEGRLVFAGTLSGLQQDCGPGSPVGLEDLFATIIGTRAAWGESS